METVTRSSAMLHFTVKKNDETLIEIKQHFLAFKSESNKERLNMSLDSLSKMKNANLFY